MRIKKFQILFVLGALLIALAGSLLYVESLGEPQNRAVAFVTLGLDQNALPNEVSSYEIQRATEHFSYIVLGWTIEPAFAGEVAEALGEGFSFGGQNQEKQSMIFTVNGASGLVDDCEPAVKFLDLIKGRIAEYNEATNAGYVVAVERFYFEKGERSDFRIVVGVMLLAGCLAVLCLRTL